MFHPTMLLLCTLNIDTFKCQDTVDYSYIQQNKEQVLHREIDNLCSKLLSDSFLFNETNGKYIAITTQFAGTKQISISLETAIILTRLREAAVFTLKNATSVDYDDISDDIIISRIEAIPSSIYSTVYNILAHESAASRNAKAGLKKLNELRKKILLYRDREAVEMSNKFEQKIEDISTVGFWRTLIYHDSLLFYDKRPNRVSADTLHIVKAELESLGIYGFVPPAQVMQAYKSTSVTRKVNVDIDDTVVDFLTEIVRSGGIEV